MGRHPADPTESTIKELFALSFNQCGFRDPKTGEGCEKKLVDPEWHQVRARICHISGKRQGSARFDESRTDEERRHFDNLILMCPNDHDMVDNLRPDLFPEKVLNEMKRKALDAVEPGRTPWASKQLLERATIVLEAVNARFNDVEELQQVPMTVVDARAGLVAEFRGTAVGTVTNPPGPPATVDVHLSAPDGGSGTDRPVQVEQIDGSGGNGSSGSVATTDSSYLSDDPIGPEMAVSSGNPFGDTESETQGAFASGPYPSGPYGGGIEPPELADEKLRTQIRQIVGYDNAGDIQPNGGMSFEVPVGLTPTDDQRERLAALAIEYGTKLDLVTPEDRVLTITPPGFSQDYPGV